MKALLLLKAVVVPHVISLLLPWSIVMDTLVSYTESPMKIAADGMTRKTTGALKFTHFHRVMTYTLRLSAALDWSKLERMFPDSFPVFPSAQCLLY